ncbi:MAG: carboxymuconolactone decarboxylase family protein [Streptosporangiales bacterium]|nr:carboxymuconolactone decarboxylase family protein [Streptosporangiales bacterium]
MSRIKMITERADVEEARQGEIDTILETLGHLGGPFSVLMHSPGLAQKVMEAGAHVRLRSTLEKWQRELAILVVAAGKASDFEWASHVQLARKAGLGEKAIDAVRNGDDPSGAGLGEDEADIVAYVRQLVAENRVDRPVYDRLVARHDERWLVELTATVGQYSYIACILGAFDVQPPADRERIGQ